MPPSSERLLASLASELGLSPSSSDAAVLSAALEAAKRSRAGASDGSGPGAAVAPLDPTDDPARDFIAAQLRDASVSAAGRRDAALQLWRGRAGAARKLASGAASLRVDTVEQGEERAPGGRGGHESSLSPPLFPTDPLALAALGAAASPPSSSSLSALGALTFPVPPEEFARRYRGRRALWVRRPRDRARFAALFSLRDLWAAAERDGGLRFGTEVDVARTVGGRRETINGPDLDRLVRGKKGRSSESSGQESDLQPFVGKIGQDSAPSSESSGQKPPPSSARSPAPLPSPSIAPYASLLEAYAEHGCSLRVLHPQRWSAAVWRVLAALEDEAGSLVGCNAYATPPGSQGFAPHWDDVDVFVLQVAGRKRWRIRAPKEAAHVLPRRSSRDLGDQDLGEDVAECLLEPGDLLYLPRGVVHYAVAEEEEGEEGDGHEPAHAQAQAQAPASLPASPSSLPAAATRGSLHLTISMDQSSTLADLLERAAACAVAEVAGEDAGLRAAPPAELGAAAGTAALAARAAAGAPADPRALALWRAARAALEAARGADALVPALARAADERAREFVRTRLPPPHLNGATHPPPAATLALTARLAAPGRDRAHLEVRDDRLALFHCLRNDRRAHAHRKGDDEDDDAIEHGHGLGGAAGRPEPEAREDEGPLGPDEPDLELAPCLVFPTVALLFPDRLPPEPEEEQEQEEEESGAAAAAGPRARVPTLADLLARWWAEAPEDWEAAGREVVAEGHARTVQDGAECALLDLAAVLEDEGLLQRVGEETKERKKEEEESDDDDEPAGGRRPVGGAMKGSILKRTGAGGGAQKKTKKKKKKIKGAKKSKA